MRYTASLEKVLDSHAKVIRDPSRGDLVDHAIEHGEAVVAEGAALATWNPAKSTGRAPKDTFIVRRPGSAGNIDWTAPNNLPLEPETFDMLWDDAMKLLARSEQLFVTERVVGADVRYALPMTLVTPRATHSLFGENMFRPVPADIEESVFASKPFTLVSIPYGKLDAKKYDGRLRQLGKGEKDRMVIVTDFDNRLGLVIGSAYCGSNKKLMFTAMNYYLPDEGILPMHCSANEGPDGDCALLLGLSGTGKTTLSADPVRALLGDDEHGWSDDGVANFENGCYAKLINLRRDKEPEIWDATFRTAHPREHGALIENCMIYPDGSFDVDDDRLTPNSRVSFPLTSLPNIKTPPMSGHPKTILFLTADATGVLPPVARLDESAAMLWFLMGYTSKLAGTETGVVEPSATFSRFFGAPFMPRNPDDYAGLLGRKIREHGTRVFLVNTGWSGGAYGEGERMDITLTRTLVNAALGGVLDDVEYVDDPLFHFAVPKRCPGVAREVLSPRNTWKDPAAFDARAKKLAGDFAKAFDRAYGDKDLDPAVVAACPGK